MQKTRNGFTIVELLIVVVVIAVLAAVAVVAYTNISARASLSAGKSFDSSLRRSLSVEGFGSYSLNEGTGTTSADSSGQNNNLIVNGGWAAGMEGGYAVQANNSTGAQASGPLYFDDKSFTVSAWVNSSDQDGAQSRIFGMGIAPATGYFFLNFGNGRPYIEARDSTNASSVWSTGQSSTNILGKWAHVAMVINREQGKSFLYINGKLESQTTNTTVTAASTGTFGTSGITDRFRIGYQYPGNPATLALDGIVDDVYIYKSALNVANIEQLYEDGRYHLARK